jgi:hypothetical protein
MSMPPAAQPITGAGGAIEQHQIQLALHLQRFDQDAADDGPVQFDRASPDHGARLSASSGDFAATPPPRPPADLRLDNDDAGAEPPRDLAGFRRSERDLAAVPCFARIAFA